MRNYIWPDLPEHSFDLLWSGFHSDPSRLMALRPMAECLRALRQIIDEQNFRLPPVISMTDAKDEISPAMGPDGLRLSDLMMAYEEHYFDRGEWEFILLHEYAHRTYPWNFELQHAREQLMHIARQASEGFPLAADTPYARHYQVQHFFELLRNDNMEEAVELTQGKLSGDFLRFAADRLMRYEKRLHDAELFCDRFAALHCSDPRAGIRALEKTPTIWAHFRQEIADEPRRPSYFNSHPTRELRCAQIEEIAQLRDQDDVSRFTPAALVRSSQQQNLSGLYLRTSMA